MVVVEAEAAVVLSKATKLGHLVKRARPGNCLVQPQEPQLVREPASVSFCHRDTWAAVFLAVVSVLRKRYRWSSVGWC